MFEDLLTLTKGRAFWMVVLFIASVLMHMVILALSGVQEPIFLLGALLMPVLLAASGVYTLFKRLARR